MTFPEQKEELIRKYIWTEKNGMTNKFFNTEHEKSLRGFAEEFEKMFSNRQGI